MRPRIAFGLVVLVAGVLLAVASAAGAAAGGGDGSAQASSAKRWTKLERSPFGRSEVAAARLGRFIYVVGGVLPGGETSDDVARYDIRRDRWRVVAPMPLAVNHPTATTWNGKLYVHGGYYSESFILQATPRLFEYDPQADRWRELAPSSTPRAAHALGAIDGKLYAAGGVNSDSDQLTSLEIYDIASDTWNAGPSMSVGRNHVASAVLDGSFYVMGGRPPDGLTVVERFDPGPGTWATLAPLGVARSGFTAAVVRGKIVAFGGEELSPGGQSIEQVEIYDPAANTWDGLPDMRTPRHGLGGASKGRRVYALEGGPQPGLSHSRALEFLEVK